MRTTLIAQLVFVLFFSALPDLQADAQTPSEATAQLPSGVIKGIVTDPSGAIVAGAQVTAAEASSMKLFRTTTNASGAYRLTALDPGKYSVRVEAHEFRSKAQMFVTVRASQTSELGLRLEGPGSPQAPEIGLAASLADVLDPDWPPLESFPFGVISGLVSDPKGQPIPQVRIGLLDESTRAAYEIATKCTGRFRRSRLKPGTYTVRFEAEGFRPAIKTGIRIGANLVTHLNIKLQPGAVSGSEIESSATTGSIVGTVTDPTGAALRAGITAIHTTTGKSFASQTDANGVYRFDGLPLGDFKLSFVGSVEATTNQEVLGGPSRTICVDVRTPVERPQAATCESSCGVPLLQPSPPHPEMSLQIYTDRSVITKGSELWLTVVLRNTTAHPILVRGDPDAASKFAFEIYAYGSCGCPGWLGKRATGAGSLRNGPDQSPAPNLLVPAGGSIVDQVDLGPILSRNASDLYTIAVSEPYAWNVETSVHAVPLITSNEINVRVVQAF